MTTSLSSPSRTERLSLRIDFHGAYIRRVNLDGANLEDGTLAGADAAYASFRHANFRNANLKGTNLRGADLTGAVNLTAEQLAEAVIDATTRLPEGLEGFQGSGSTTRTTEG